jgi:hypothetical protein
LLWPAEGNKRFKPTLVSEILGENNTSFEHPVFGTGFVWEYGNPGTDSLRLQLFPRHRQNLLLRVGIADSFDYQIRDYLVTRLAGIHNEQTRGLRAEAGDPGRRAIVTILTTGHIIEESFFPPLNNRPLVREGEQPVYLTVLEAAKEFGKDPSTIRQAASRGCFPSRYQRSQLRISRIDLKEYYATVRRGRRPKNLAPTP